jgi:YHS domain-containing protein
MAVDPVCGMQVNEEEAAAHTDYQGDTYYFCSEWCQEEFAKDPEKYVPPGKVEEKPAE